MTTGIFRRTEKHKRNISEALIGRKLSNKHKENLRKSHIGQKAWNKGLKGCIVCSDETKKKMSNAHKGREFSQKHKKNLSISAKKVKRSPLSEKTKRKLREIQISYLENVRRKTGISFPCVGRYEKTILDYLESIWDCKIQRQKKVIGYFLDGYCPMFNLVIEIDEKFHNKKKDKDQLRENNIKNTLNCSFLRIDVGDCGG